MKLLKPNINRYYLSMIELAGYMDTPIIAHAEDVTKQLADRDDINKIIRRYFPGWFYIMTTTHDESEVQALHNDFSDAWQSFIEREQHNIDRMYEAYFTDYNPLDNYDRNTHSSTRYEGTEKDSLSKSGSINHTEGTQTTTDTTQTSPDSSENWKNTDKNTNISGERTDSDSFTDYKEENTKSFTNRIDTYDERTRGNIGVTTSMQMLRGELEGRTFDIVLFFISKFVYETCIQGGAELWEC